MKIVYLGWGSLIWNPVSLKTTGEWQTDGPNLPVEFARVSMDGRLTLVLHPETKRLPVLWIYSEFKDLDNAINDLQLREGTRKSYIGYVSIKNNRYNCNIVQSILGDIKDWAIEKNIDAEVWTDLPSNFEEKTNSNLKTDNTIKYLKNLPTEKQQKAEEYIEKAPVQIMTPFRKEIKKTFEWKYINKK